MRSSVHQTPGGFPVSSCGEAPACAMHPWGVEGPLIHMITQELREELGLWFHVGT